MLRIIRDLLAAVAVLCAVLARPAPTAAQHDASAGELVLLLLPEAALGWHAALDLELGLRGTRVEGGESIAPPTPLIGDATAQSVALESAATAALWVRVSGSGFELRLVRTTSDQAHVVRVAQDVDARTVALIVASLLDRGAEAPGPITEVHVIEASPAERSPRQALAAPVGPEVEEAPPVEEELPAESVAPAGPHVRWSGRVGLSAMALTNFSGTFFPSATLRAGIALRYDAFELAVMHDLGLYVPLQEPNPSVQPLGRACLEAGGAMPTGDVQFHGGGRGCVGSVFATDIQFLPEGAFATEGPRTHLSLGAYAALSFRLEDWIRIFVRADIDLGWTQVSFGRFEALPALSSYLSFS